jgi:hypothetical protein
MGLYVVQTADSPEPAPRDAARAGRAAAMQRRRQLSRGKQALNGSRDRAPAATGTRAPTFVVHRGGAG